MSRHAFPGVDLDIKVTVRTVDGDKVLHYALSSPSSAAPLNHCEVQTAPFKGSFDTFRDRLISRIESFQEHLDPFGSSLESEEFEPELRKLGQELYRQLFPTEMKWMYRQWRNKVRTIQISSDEWWIPWELIKPFDHELEPVINDDFLCARYEITRWLIGGTAPAARTRVEKMACVEAGDSERPRLKSAVRERELLLDLAQRRGIEDVSPAEATLPNLMSLFERGGLDLLHFVGHGEFSRANPEDSRIFLCDGRSLAVGDLEVSTLRAIAAKRPLVFFNACSVGQQGAALTSLSGWPDAWIGRGGAGAFVAPLWEVRDSLAFEFARIFYRALAKDRSLGRAARLARRFVRRRNRQHATWLAFAVYGHPNARVSFGCGDISPLSGECSQPGLTGMNPDSSEGLVDPTFSASLDPARTDLASMAHNQNASEESMDESEAQLAESNNLHEQEPDLRGRWRGTWQNLVNHKQGEEMIDIVRQENGRIEGQFFDPSTYGITIKFEGHLRFGNLFVRYWAPKGQRVMQDGCCFLKLQDNGNWEGYYAEFSACGRYELKVDQQRY